MQDYTTLDFFGYNDDQKEVLSLLRQSKISKEKKVCLMAAPSFVVDFDFHTFVPLMKSLGFDQVTELTFGARITNKEYEKYVKKNKKKQKKFISSVCPASVNYIKNALPEMKNYLLPFDSPMGAVSKVCKKNFPKHKIVFLSPCGAKKIEASMLVDKKGKKLIDAVLTFSEMKQIVAKEKPKIIKFNEPKSAGFDCFYNDYTKIYPLAGGLCGTLHHKDILSEKEIAVCDGFSKFKEFFKKNEDKIFFDILFCKGGCIGGPGVASQLPIFIKKHKVISYSNFAKKENMNGKRGLEKYIKGIDFSKQI
jgi:iron only hydrogenase large subunit-like protein